MEFSIFWFSLFLHLLLKNAVSKQLESVNNHDAAVSSFSECLQRCGIPGTKFVPRDLNCTLYNTLNKQWNLRKDVVYPREYILPTTTEDVSAMVKCALSSKIHLVPNSGGHSFESTGWGNGDQIVMDFRNMNEIRVEGNGQNAVAYIETGATMGKINAHLWENGGYALSMGSCLTIGIGGHVIGGGMTLYAGVYGLAVDNVLEMEMVDAQGNIVLASDSENSDLFWALRGSGPGYIGILTKIKFKLFQASKIKLTAVVIQYNVKDFTQGFIALQNFQNWLKTNEMKIGFLGFTVSSDTYNQTIPAIPPGMLVGSLHIQDPVHQPEGPEKYLEAIRKFFPTPGVISTFSPKYLEYVALTSSVPNVVPDTTTGKLIEVGNMLNFYNNSMADLRDEKKILSFFKSLNKEDAAPRYFKAKGFFTKQQFPVEDLAKLQEIISRIPTNNIWLLFVAVLGKVKEPLRNATGFVHRDAILEVTTYYEGSSKSEDVIPGMKYLYELYETIKFMDGGESYQNIPDLDDKNYLDKFYMENLQRLVDIKRQWDPTNFFISDFSLPLTLNKNENLSTFKIMVQLNSN